MQTHTIPAVVVDADNLIALDTIRTLGFRGVPVIAVFCNKTGNAASHESIKSSRYVQSTVQVQNNLVETLLQLASQLPLGAVLIPLSDRSMLTISEARAKLAPCYRLRMPPPEMIDILLDKNRFAEIALKQEIPVPTTFVVSDEPSLSRAVASATFPCIIKPPCRDGKWEKKYGTQKVVEAHSSAELHHLGLDTLQLCGHFIVQEIVQGPEANLFCTFAFLDDQSNSLSMSACRKLRQNPPYYGNTTLAECVTEPELEALAREIGSKLRLVGYVSIEFKFDLRSSKWLVLEITPCRINFQAAGVTALARRSIVVAWYRELAGLEPEPAAPLRVGVRWVSQFNDLKYLPVYLRNRDWTLAGWLWSYSRVRKFSTLSLRDPWPFLVKLGYTLKKRFPGADRAGRNHRNAVKITDSTNDHG